MSGIQIYKEMYNEKSQTILEKNKNIEHLEDFYNYIYAMSSSSSYAYIKYVVKFMSETNKKESELTLNDFTRYMNRISNMSSSYQIVVYSALKKYSDFLYETGIIHKNFMEKISRPESTESDETIEKREIAYLEKNEIKSYIQHVSEGAGSNRAKARQEEWKERDILLIQLFLNTGLRCAAIYKLDISSIDLEKKILVVRDKGNKRNESYLSDDMVDLIQNWLNKREMLLNGKEEEALFISNRRTRMTQLSIANVVNKYAENIDGKNITPHKLRATYGTQLYNKTKDVYFVQKMMNHSSPKTTELYIRGKKNENKIKASEIMNELTMN